jgi:hypothetical protein
MTAAHGGQGVVGRVDTEAGLEVVNLKRRDGRAARAVREDRGASVAIAGEDAFALRSPRSRGA